MNQNTPSGRPRAVVGYLEGDCGMKLEAPAHRYRREAAECELNAQKAANAVDQLAWRRLADDWMKLARAAEVNPRLKTIREGA
jgi:hypothetical protein